MASASAASGEARPDAEVVTPFAELPACHAQSGLDLLGEYFGLDAQRRAGALAQVIEMTDAQFDFLVVAVPEPSLGFDGTVEAVTRALEATGHTLDRYFLPWEPTAGQGKNPSMPSSVPRCQDRYPGVALFQHAAAGKGDPRRILLVYLVGESPVAGTHKAAFLSAAEEIADLKALLPPSRCGGAGLPCGELRFVGPAFSGAAASLEQILDRLLETQPETGVRILTGRATSPAIQRQLERHATQARPVTLQATVIPDDALQTEFFCYLTETLGADEHDIAIVSESSTAYGQGVMAASDASALGARPRVLPERGAEPGGVPAVSLHCREPHRPRLVLPVPLSISRLHSAWAKAPKPATPAASDALGTTSPQALPRYQDEAARTDVIPTLSERAVSAADRALANILTTISAEKIRYVGVVATDMQDKLFLAEQIRKYCPDVVLFTFESDILYTHPDVRPFLRGMMVVSPYPLFTRNQQWSFPFRGWQRRLQFSRDVDQGVYNATVAMLGRPEQLLEYSQAAPGVGAPSSRPAIWISAVGIDTLFPLRFVSDYAERGYVYKNPQSARSGYLYSPYQQGTLSVLLLSLGLVGALFVIGYFACAYGMSPLRFPLRMFDLFRPRRFRRSSLGDRVGRGENERQPFYVLLLFLPASALYFFLTTIHFVQLREGNESSFSLFEGPMSPWLRFWHHSSHIGIYENLTWRVLALGLLCALFEILFLGASLDALAHVTVPRLRARVQSLLLRAWASLGRLWPLRAGLVLVLLSLSSFLMFQLFVLLVNHLQRDFNTLMFLRRCAHPAFGLSPAVPLWILCAGLQLWGYYNLKRMQLLERLAQVYLDLLDHFPDLHPEPAPGDGDGDAETASRRGPGTARPRTPDATGLRREIESIARLLESPPRWRVLLALSLAGVLMVTVLAELVSLETYPLNFLFRALFALLLICVGYALYRFLRLWLHFRTFLAGLAHHPIAAAFDRMPSKFARSLGVLLLEELPELTRRDAERTHLRLLRNHLRQFGLEAGRPDKDPPELAALFQREPELRDQFIELLALPEDAIGPASRHVMFVLRRFWDARPLPGPAPAPAAPGTPERRGPPPWAEQALRTLTPSQSTLEHYLLGVPDTLHLWLRLCEDFVAVQLVSFISRLFPHLRNTLFFMTAGLMLLLIAGVMYPFQPAHFLMMLVWLVILTTVPIMVMVFVQMNREEVLSRVAKAEPGRITWDRRFVSQVVLYGALPLLSVLAAQFPEVRGAAFSWLESILKTLK